MRAACAPPVPGALCACAHGCAPARAVAAARCGPAPPRSTLAAARSARARAPEPARRRSAQPRGHRVAVLSLDDLVPPPIDGDLRSLFEEAGATLDDDGVALSFGDDEAALEALADGMVVFDRSHWVRQLCLGAARAHARLTTHLQGRVRVSGEGALPFLQAQVSADVASLRAGGGCEAALTTPGGGCADLVTVLVTAGGGALLLTSPGTAGEVAAELRRRAFPADRVELADVSSATGCLALAGPACAEALRRLGAAAVAGAPAGTHALFGFQGTPVVVAAGCGLASAGATLVCDESVAGALWAALTAPASGGVPAGEAAWQRLRVAEGRPQRGQELLGDATTPLDAALGGMLSLAKGCFLGREALVAAHAPGAPPRRSLWGVRAQPGADGLAPGAPLALPGAAAPCGVLTSACAEDGTALAYVDDAAAPADGLRVRVGDATPALLIQQPFARRALAAEAPATAPAAGSEDAAEAARKEAKLAAMAARVAAYEAAQRAQKQ